MAGLSDDEGGGQLRNKRQLQCMGCNPVFKDASFLAIQMDAIVIIVVYDKRSVCYKENKK